MSQATFSCDGYIVYSIFVDGTLAVFGTLNFQICYRVYIGKYPSFTSVKNKVKLEYINEENPSSLELTFGVELDLSHYSF